ncbi:hypothetical protein [Richelia intracellularis]
MPNDFRRYNIARMTTSRCKLFTFNTSVAERY